MTLDWIVLNLNEPSENVFMTFSMLLQEEAVNGITLTLKSERDKK